MSYKQLKKSDFEKVPELKKYFYPYISQCIFTNEDCIYYNVLLYSEDLDLLYEKDRVAEEELDSVILNLREIFDYFELFSDKLSLFILDEHRKEEICKLSNNKK